VLSSRCAGNFPPPVGPHGPPSRPRGDLWRDAEGHEAGKAFGHRRSEAEGGWQRLEGAFQAPPDADWLRRNCNHTWRNRLAVERRPSLYRDL